MCLVPLVRLASRKDTFALLLVQDQDEQSAASAFCAKYRRCMRVVGPFLNDLSALHLAAVHLPGRKAQT
jgi:hypothetical protein